MLAPLVFSCIMVFIVGTDTEGKHSTPARHSANANAYHLTPE